MGLLRIKVKALGLKEIKSENKFVPSHYLYGSTFKRLALLKGLLDSDDSSNKDKSVVFHTSSP